MAMYTPYGSFARSLVVLARYKGNIEGQQLRSLCPHLSGKPSLRVPTPYHSPSPNATSSPMDFFFNLFGPTRTELDSEVEQVPVDFDGSSGQPGGCVVA
jgi:hypothetical protein